MPDPVSISGCTAAVGGSLGLSMQDSGGWANLPATTRPLQRVLAVSEDKGMLEWGVRMYVGSRQLERIGDNAVDIGEQVAFLVTGQFREFTDACHPEVEHPTPVELGDVAQADEH